nr:hypothetical protein [Lachnospiraceae bacterium]
MNLDFIELSNIEINEFCRLDKSTSEKEFYNKKKIHSFTGLYYKEEDLFFALYPTESGPMMYYEGKEYP